MIDDSPNQTITVLVKVYMISSVVGKMTQTHSGSASNRHQLRRDANSSDMVQNSTVSKTLPSSLS